MIGALRTPEQQTVTVFGGSGFLGRYVVGALAQRGYRILVPTRQPNLSNFLPLGKVGQITPIHANLRNEDSIAHAVARADHVVNLVGILQETGRQRFDALSEQARRTYGMVQAAGSPLEDPDALAVSSSSDRAADNFVVAQLSVERIDWLRLSEAGQRRAEILYEGLSATQRWIAP